MPNVPKGDWMKPYEADEKIAQRAREDWERGKGPRGPDLTMEQALVIARAMRQGRRDGWAEKAVAVIGVNRAAAVYFDTYNALAEGGTEKKTFAQLEAEIAEVLARRKSW